MYKVSYILFSCQIQVQKIIKHVSQQASKYLSLKKEVLYNILTQSVMSMKQNMVTERNI
jgi:hypothetical protein